MGTKPSVSSFNRRILLKAAAAGTISLPAPLQGLAAQELTPEISSIVESAREELGLRVVIVTVQDANSEVFLSAWGESQTGIPATPDMHFRTGAVAITYIGVVLLSLVDDGLIDLDQPIATWLPDMPESDRATPRMLAQMTAGYPDYVRSDEFTRLQYEDPFRTFGPDELIDFGLAIPRTFAPGENWDYTHTGIQILAKVIESASGQTLDTLISERVFEPLELRDTYINALAPITTPALHTFSSERRTALGIQADVPFYEETTGWNPSWTLPPAAVQHSTIQDVASSFRRIGQGEGLSEAGFASLTSTSLIGFGSPVDGCPTCHPLDDVYAYGMCLVLSNGWYVQNPMFAGCGATVATHRDAGYTIAAATTFGEAAYDSNGNNQFGNSSQTIVRRISEILVPDEPLLLK